MVTPKELLDYLWSRDSYGRTRLQYQMSAGILMDAIESAEAELDEDKTFKYKVRDEFTGVAYTVEFKIEDVVIEKVCENGHDFGPWKYDYMGGDIRACVTCGTREHQ